MSAAQDRARRLLAVSLAELPYGDDALSDALIECRDAMRRLLDESAPAPRLDGSQAATCTRPDGSAVLSPADLLTVLSALRAAAEASPALTTAAEAVSFRSLSWRLGDDQS